MRSTGVQLREAKDSRRLDRPFCTRHSGSIPFLVAAACLFSLAGCWDLDLAVFSEGSGANSEAMEWTAIMIQDESVGFVQGTAFRSGNHCALRALVSQIQTEFSGLGPNDGGTRNCADAHNDSALGAALCA